MGVFYSKCIFKTFDNHAIGVYCAPQTTDFDLKGPLQGREAWKERKGKAEKGQKEKEEKEERSFLTTM